MDPDEGKEPSNPSGSTKKAPAKKKAATKKKTDKK